MKKCKTVADDRALDLTTEATSAVRLPRKDHAELLARITVHPTVQAANTIHKYKKAQNETQFGVEALVAELTKEVVAVSIGNLGRVEGMLIAQAHSLDAIFNTLARRASTNAGEHLGACETYLRLALKAQSQCRATLETLAAVKHPPAIYARQANVTTGPQQINNGMGAEGAVSPGTEIEQSKLLEAQHGQWLDTGAASSTSDSNPQLETLAGIHRAKDNAR
jgi:hypothetical protein